RFRAEAEAVARLRHPNIVQIYEVGEHDGRPFLALEFIEGGTLASRLGPDLPPARQAVELVEVLARAMDFAHRNGVVHRDLKPANILLENDEARTNAQSRVARSGRSARSSSGTHQSCAVGSSERVIPKVSDFGLAKRLDDDSHRT